MLHAVFVFQIDLNIPELRLHRFCVCRVNFTAQQVKSHRAVQRARVYINKAERLCSRFEWGLIADIQKPDIETRIAILRKKAMSENIMVGDDVLELIASRIESNIRELEGSLTRLVAFSTLHKRPIDVALCEEALKEVFEQKAPRRVDENVVMSAVSDYYGVTPEDLKSSRRNREITVPRQVAMYLCRQKLGLSYPELGRAFGGKDHSTVIHAIKKIKKLLVSDKDVQRLVTQLETTAL